MVTKTLQWHGATLRAGEDGLSQCPNWGSVFAGECLLTWCWRATTVAAEQHGGGKGGGGTEGGGWWGMRGVGSGSKFSSSPESMRQSSSEPGSDCQAPGYPCSGRGNVCDYLLCKPPKLDKGKEWGRGGWTVKTAWAGDAHCFVCAHWRQAALCFGNEMRRSK